MPTLRVPPLNRRDVGFAGSTDPDGLVHLRSYDARCTTGASRSVSTVSFCLAAPAPPPPRMWHRTPAGRSRRDPDGRQRRRDTDPAIGVACAEPGTSSRPPIICSGWISPCVKSPLVAPCMAAKWSDEKTARSTMQSRRSGRNSRRAVEDPLGHHVAEPRRAPPSAPRTGRRTPYVVAMWKPAGREARVHHRRDLHADRRMLRHLAAPAGLVARLLQLGIRDERGVEARPRVGVQVLERRPVARQARQLEEQVHVGAAVLDALDPLDGRRRRDARVPTSPKNVAGLSRFESTARAVIRRAVAQLDADRAPVLDQRRAGPAS